VSIPYASFFFVTDALCYKEAWADYHFFCDLPALESAGLSISATSFEGYRESLQKQLNGRTPTLDELLSPMEARVQRIVNDVARMRQDGDDVQYDLSVTLVIFPLIKIAVGLL
jgi:hypothetical protein